MLKITSQENQRIKTARRVRAGRERNLVFAEGARLAQEALRAGLSVSDILFTADFADSARGREFIENAAARNLNHAEVSAKVFDSLSDTKESQGVIVVGEKPAHGKAVIETGLKNKAVKFSLVILLHRINNPTNLGAILRTAEAVGVIGIITTKNSADVFSPKALRGAMGASLRIPCWQNADFAEALAWARDKGLKSVCAAARGEKSYTEIEWREPKLLVMGSEAHGLTEEEADQTDESLTIPMENGVESLNVAVACAVILFEAKRQRTMYN